MTTYERWLSLLKVGDPVVMMNREWDPTLQVGIVTGLTDQVIIVSGRRRYFRGTGEALNGLSALFQPSAEIDFAERDRRIRRDRLGQSPQD